MKRQTRDGFLSSVTLKAVHPKTKELTVLPAFDLPREFQHIGMEPTAVEARHFAATWALYRVSSMKNIHMMLPPKYKDLWKGEFPNIKKDYELKGLGWKFEADPFLAKEEQDKVHALIQKKKDDALRKAQAATTSTAENAIRVPKRDFSRGWESIPAAEMGNNMRIDVEDVVRKYATWNVNGISISETDRQAILDELTTIGFRRTHIIEALNECKDREEVLEWLLIHVPEDDLPDWCLPESYQAGVTFVTGNLQKEAFIRRMTDCGYSVNLERTYELHNGNVAASSEALQTALCAESINGIAFLETGATDDDPDMWNEEVETLFAIFGDRYKKLSETRCSILFKSDNVGYTFEFEKTRFYPTTPPVILSSEKTLPAYIKLATYKKAWEYARTSLLGGPMIFSLCDWLEAEIPKILVNPGSLKDLKIVAEQSIQLNTNVRHKKVSDLGQMVRRVDWSGRSKASNELRVTWERKQSTSGQISMLSSRQKLPAWNIKDQLVDVVNKNQITIVSGATGSGKSTQCPQFILDDMLQRNLGAVANILVTQPRRVSALGLADRVSDERCGSVGDEVGYAIRGDTRWKIGKTKITFMTTGVLLRRLQNDNGLSDVTHVIIDEIHERSLDSDFLLALLKDYLIKWKDLKLILMSATLDSNIFNQYFKAFTVGALEIEGRTFDVTDHYLDDVVRSTGFNAGLQGTDMQNIGKVIQNMGQRINYDLVIALVQHIHESIGANDGSILIFLPGVGEIDRTTLLLGKLPGIYALPLHASLHPAEQKRVFLKAPRNMRKVVAATNVAETSITIDDCVAVIDTGKVKETSFDPNLGMIKLEEVWASRAACQQRKGRAGRVRPGDCYKLFTRNAEEAMKPRPDPEIKRVPLEQLVLSIYALGISDAAQFLAKAITPPETTAVDAAVELLRRMSALDGNQLTTLGYHLSRVPADLRLAKLMIYGAMFNCLENCLTIAAILTVRSPFVSPQHTRDEAKTVRLSFARNHGDLVGDLMAYEQWNQRRKADTSATTKRWCEENYLSTQTLFDITSNKMQFQSALKDAGFLSANYGLSDTSFTILNSNNQDLSLLRSLIAGSFSPQIARIAFPDKKYAASVSGAVELDPEARTIKYFTQDTGRVFIHPSSTLFEAQTFPGSSSYLSFFSKMATSKQFIRDLTPFNVYALLMFAGTVRIDTLGRGLVVDGWLRVRGWARIGVLIGRLRVILDHALEAKLENPADEAKDVVEITDLVRRLIQYCGMDR